VRNLRRAAARIEELGGFPRDHDAIRELPGVGPYTAAAVASIAFNAPRAAVDGNVLRVIARLTGDSSDIRSAATKARFEKKAAALLDARDPGRFNQAMMELGATICLPRNPLCLLCPVAAGCQARLAGTQEQLPVKLGRAEPVRIAATLLVIERSGRLLLWRRDPESQRLGGFWELPSAEDLPHARTHQALGSFRHSITHHNYTFTVVTASARRVSKRFQWFERSELARLPVSTTARKALDMLSH
jgi:A/G-specific adenine glycosylase